VQQKNNLQIYYLFPININTWGTDRWIKAYEDSRQYVPYTGWGKITSLNFKVNNKKKTIRDTKILFLDSETTIWEVLNHIVLKKNILQVVAVVCVVFACRAPGRLQNGPSDSLDVLWCSRGPWSSSSFFRHTSRFPEVLNWQQNGFSVRYSVPRGDLVASTERTLHRYDSDFAKSRFRRQMRAARWTTPSLRLGSVVTGTPQLPAPFEPNPTLLRPPLPSQCPTESREDILLHPVASII